MHAQHRSAPLYPVFLSLAGLHCLVAGLGEVGRRKLAGLLVCGPASVLALDIAPPSPEAAELLRDAHVHFEQRPCDAADIPGRHLVFAATSDAEENRRIAMLCAEHGAWCNCASAPEQGRFQVPAVVRRPPLAAALSSGGASPALARRWKGDLENWLAPRSRMATLLGRLRPLALAVDNDTRQHARLFRALVDSPLQRWLADNNLEACRDWLQTALPPALRGHVAELLHDLP